VGYSMPFGEGSNAEQLFFEGCIVYRFHKNGAELCSACIAHEILHLYGAWDLYRTFEQTYDRELKARELFPNDIMLRVSYGIDELEVGPLSAWLVGWNNQCKGWYQWFRPQCS